MNLTTSSSSPFGMQMQNRTWEALENGYRFGFNGKERDDEVSGSGNCIAFEARIYDSRLGRWYSVDVFTNAFPSFSPYSGYAGNPLLYIDVDGNKIKLAEDLTAEEITKVEAALVLFKEKNAHLYNILENGKILNGKLVMPGDEGYESVDAVELTITIHVKDLDNMPEMQEKQEYEDPTDVVRHKLWTDVPHLNGSTSPRIIPLDNVTIEYIDDENENGSILIKIYPKPLEFEDPITGEIKTFQLPPLVINTSIEELKDAYISMLREIEIIQDVTEFDIYLDDYINSEAGKMMGLESDQIDLLGAVLSHEGGHILQYLHNKDVQYFYDMIDQSGGHEPGNQGGEEAEKQEAKYNDHEEK